MKNVKSIQIFGTPWPRRGICKIFYTSKIPKLSILPKKCINCDIFGQKLRMEDFLTLENCTPAQKYFTQVSLVANSTSALTLTSKASTTKAKVFEVMSVCLPWEWTGLVRLTRCLSLPPRRLHDSWLTSRRCDWKKPFGGIGPFIYIAHCPQGPASTISGSQNLISVLKQSLVWHRAVQRGTKAGTSAAKPTKPLFVAHNVC